MNRLGRFVMSVVVSLACALAAASHAAETKGKSASEAARLQVQQVDVRLSQMGPVVLLKIGNKAIPIFVDTIVAESIQAALTGQKLPRPLTHELMRSVLEGFDGRVSQVVVTLKDRTYYGALTVVVRGTTKVFDSRSSDAIALAIHFKAPILVGQDLLDSAGIDLDAPEPKAKPRGSET
jgi:uncharacterized protein